MQYESKLRRMSAKVLRQNECVVKYYVDDVEKRYIINNPVLLLSYNSIVAIYDGFSETVFVLPRFEYSVTTIKHVRAFIEDETPFGSVNISEIRKEISDIHSSYRFIYAEAFAYQINVEIFKWWEY